jgi:putative transposase
MASNAKLRRAPSGEALTREVAFRFELDPNNAQRSLLAQNAGAARATFNHQIGRVKKNLDIRAAEKELLGAAVTPGLSWAKFSLIKETTAWKNGTSPESPLNEDGTRGLAWRGAVSCDVFECASVDAAEALGNFASSLAGTRAGERVGFPYFKSKYHVTPSFRLRNKVREDESETIRVNGPKSILLPKIGVLRIQGSLKQMRVLLEKGRFHIYSATLTYEHGKWWIALAGVATPLHHQRRDHREQGEAVAKHPLTAGMDVGIKSLAVLADSSGQHLVTFEGVNTLRDASSQIKRAQQTLARTTPGSGGYRHAKKRLNRLCAHAAGRRDHYFHEVTLEIVQSLSVLVIEDLDVKGMAQHHGIAKGLTDAPLGKLLAMLQRKATWYGCEVILASRWYASSKTCSSCGTINESLTLSDRMFVCPSDTCDLVIDRDLNAAINLSRWPEVREAFESERAKKLRTPRTPKATPSITAVGVSNDSAPLAPKELVSAGSGAPF